MTPRHPWNNLDSGTGPEGTTIFNLLEDNRPAGRRLWSIAASVAINLFALTTLAAVTEISAARRASERLMSELRKELGRYRMVLLLPPQALPASPEVKPPALRPGPRVQPAPRPLATPNPRLLQRMDPQILGFVRDNPGIEAIVTRELVRDVDNKVLDVSQLLRKSSMRVRFTIDEEGRVARTRVVRSSGVPSIDHLALELVRLLEKYGLLAAVKGVRVMLVTIRVDDEIAVEFRGEAPDRTEVEQIRKQVASLLTLARFALAADAAFLLQGVTVEAKENVLLVHKSYEKDPLVKLILRYFQTPGEPGKEPPQQRPPPAP